MINCPPITLILPSLEIGGEERVLALMANELTNTYNAKVNFITIFNHGEFKSMISPKINLISFSNDKNLTLFNLLPIVFKFIFFLKHTNIKCIISSLVRTNIFVLALTRYFRPDIPIIIRQASTTNKLCRHKLLAYIVKYFYPKADKIICVSSGISNDLQKYFNISKNKLTVINNPINFQKIVELSYELVNNDLFDTNNKLIITVGRLIPQKDHKTLISAFKTVREKVDCNLLIMGDGPLYDELSQYIKTNNLSPNVKIISGCSNPYKYMKLADLFVLSSIQEGFVVVLLEALALGKAIVSTDCHSSPAEILKNGKYGSLVPPNNPRALAEKIISHFYDPQSTNFNVMRAKEFSMENILPKLIALINELAHRRKTP